MNGKTIGIIGLAFTAALGVGFTVVEVINRKKEEDADQEFLEQIQANTEEIEKISEDIDNMTARMHEETEKTKALIEKIKAAGIKIDKEEE